ncbi:hypothetical protein PVAND_013837 [Polypedilum vanderplanki]|uniref:CWH43-like N-terminal domain-containing protein n=1 Tax=Polypedilum vanderplanki TaxID=319348 RepID=A0A9J6CRT9_POLVA|nr:hypothetical protein PVAND_013837 [Polypedilum vanderplanki]
MKKSNFLMATEHKTKSDELTKRSGESDGTSINNSNNDNVVLFRLSLRALSNWTLMLPLTGLFICFVTGYIFQAEEIHETHCRVYNIIPSISSITGIRPQIYLWRAIIALHISPRLVIAFVHKNYLKHHVLSQVRDQTRHAKATKLATVVHYLNLIEIASLGGVTYVSNKENYPIHEKIFITFMITSLTYMLVSLKLLKVLLPNGPRNEQERRSLRYKKSFFALSIASTIGLIVFFLKHRFLCHDLAFSWFAFCEYVVAISNMGFHSATTMIDFPPLDLVVKNVHGHLVVEDVEEKDENEVVLVKKDE